MTADKVYCEYCKTSKQKLQRCSGCKIAFYCSKECQSKHWKLIHKTVCKEWKVKYHNKSLTQHEYEDLSKEIDLKLIKMADWHYGPKIDRYQQMMKKRREILEKEQVPDMLFDTNQRDDSHRHVMNNMMSAVMKAFDIDEDGNLNLNEWKAMLKELDLEYISEQYLFQICVDIGLIPSYYPSANNGSYGTYLYPKYEILFGPHDVMNSLRFCAYFRAQIDTKEDEPYDLNDGIVAMSEAFGLLMKLYGHAQSINFLGELSELQFFDIVHSVVPCFGDDVISVLYDYHTTTGQNVIKISWHRIKWLSYSEDLESFWDLYDGRRQYYDVCYISKQDKQCYRDTMINIEICDDMEHCNKKLETLKSGLFGHSMVDMEERMESKEKWCLGICPSYIPYYSFDLKENAMLIGNVLKLHGLDPKKCHYIYVGVGIRGSAEEKAEIVNQFRNIYETNTKFRPQKPKAPMFF